MLILLSLFVCWTAANEEIGDEGVIRMLEGLEKNSSMQGLYLGGVFSHSFVIHSCIHCCVSHSSFINVE
jgi:hypothetical protein